jgi:hypothetical protein
MNLTRDNWVTIIFGVGLLVLTIVLNIAVVEEWRKPYVQYVTGGAYIHPKLAIATVGLMNRGGSDAENVTIAASFADPVTNFNSDRVTTPFEPSAGGIGQKDITGTIKRLVLGEIVNIYFLMEPSSLSADQKPVVREIKFNGGLGKTGEPILRTWGLLLASFALWGGICFAVAYYRGRRQRIRYLSYLTGAIQRGHSARQEGISDEQLRTWVEEWYKTLPFLTRPRLETLITCAQATFEGANQSPTQTAGLMR